jgi:hypothetical protein
MKSVAGTSALSASGEPSSGTSAERMSSLCVWQRSTFAENEDRHRTLMSKVAPEPAPSIVNQGSDYLHQQDSAA